MWQFFYHIKRIENINQGKSCTMAWFQHVLLSFTIGYKRLKKLKKPFIKKGFRKNKRNFYINFSISETAV